MPIIAKNNGNGGNYEPLPTGLQQAVCAFVEDIGTHADTYQGRPVQRHQIIVCWELAEKMTLGDNAGKPFMVSKFYTLSLNEKATLRKDLESWRGRAFTDQELDGFDVEKLIGANCMLNIVDSKKQDGTPTQKIGSIAPVLKQLPKIIPVNDMPPKWIQKQREESLEWKEQNGGSKGHVDSDNSIPPQEDLPF